MVSVIRSEFLKFFTTRLWWGMAIAIFIAAALFAVLFGFLLTIPPTQESIEHAHVGTSSHRRSSRRSRQHNGPASPFAPTGSRLAHIAEAPGVVTRWL